jgi:antagonist of KipI
MLADRQTTGGYPKIATACSVDLSRIGQAKPGDTVHFVAISKEEGLQLLQARETALKKWMATLPTATGRIWNFQLSIAGQKFSTYVEEIR